MDEIHYGAWVVQPVSQSPPATTTTAAEKANKTMSDCGDTINIDDNNNNSNNNVCDADKAKAASEGGKVISENDDQSARKRGELLLHREATKKPTPEQKAMRYESEEEEEEGASGASSDDRSSSTREHAPLLFIDDDDDDDDDVEQVGENADEEDMEWAHGNVERQKKITANRSGTTKDQQTNVNLPLIDYLCAYNNSCTLKELDALFHCVPARRRMLVQLQQHCNLRTAHLRPSERNIGLHAHDFSARDGNKTFACGGYLGLTVRQYFFAKHGIRLKHAHLPTLIEFGGGTHASYYPLECVHVVLSAFASGGGGGSAGCTNAAVNDIANGSSHRWRVARRTHAPPSAGGSFCWPPGLTTAAAAAAAGAVASAAPDDDGHRCCCAACRR